ncbi:hypothetical protein TUM20983_00450 [Mycobacterium antarcticum]|uniref:phosphoribosyltransferase family protein n=1 Tax=Mycolicibacterium sp. TUM20983 TaxID=3023369 RepID=UPI00238FC310|nr:phosphoribosyltransferase family protein [Mycolicibacterium sp. TUM20983]GLP72935.1 hypothetical protein TUM20983_00450 [Mycolicibacterium sp. TUM20983]
MTAAGTESWVTREFGIRIAAQASDSGYSAKQLVIPGLRRNPRRAHLLVSTVLGKHLPVSPAEALSAADRLGDLVAEVLGESAADATVLGFAETATGLGHCVAARLGAAGYLHSTRRRVPGAQIWGGFEEGHSHATSHTLMPSNAALLEGDSPLVLVDDEFSTGATALGAIRALAGLSPRRTYVVASLVDLRDEAHHAAMTAAATELGIRIDSVSLAQGRISLPDGVIERVCALPEPEFNPRAPRRGVVRRVELPWPPSVPDGGRHGFLATDTAPFDDAVAQAANALRPLLDSARPMLVIGHEELMYLPLRLAGALEDHGLRAAFQSSTRSPAHVLDQPGYPLRRGFRFWATEDGETEYRYLYNARWPWSDASVVEAQIVLVVDSPADTARLWADGGLVGVLASAGGDVVVAVLPGVDPRVLHDARRGHG